MANKQALWMPETVIYKHRRVIDKFCTECNEFLQGNGSIITPYKCLCGTYEHNYATNKYELKLTKGGKDEIQV